MKRFFPVLCIVLLCSSVMLAQVQNPTDYFGFQPGSDYKLIGWQKLIDYFELLDDASEKVSIAELGKTTNGHPLIMAIVSSKENMQQLDEIRNDAKRIADPRGLSGERAREIARDGKAIVLITCSLHATEVGAAQATPEMVYDLVYNDTEENREILDNVVFLLVPSFNPDGLILVKEWYDQYLETEFEGSSMPWLYHHYVGHDNNRDAFMLTQAESRMINKVLYHDWLPPIYLDMHQMGNSASRIFVPPFIDPLNVNTDPLIVWEIGTLGYQMALDLEANGKAGVGNSHFFTGWWEGSFLMNVWWHNTVGLLTELASVKIATPIFQEKNDLQGGRRGLPVYGKLMNFPNPWPGGWWRLRDIVEYDLIAAKSVLKSAARYKESFIYNRYLMGVNALQAGEEKPPYAFLVPPVQRDPATARKMINILMEGGVEVCQAKGEFTADGIDYPEGTFVILMKQPFRAYAKDLMEPQVYPDIKEGGEPIRPYDVSGWTLPYQMGVKSVQITRSFEADLQVLQKAVNGQTYLPRDVGYGYLLRHGENNSFKITNKLLKDGYSVYWAQENQIIKGISVKPGDIIIPKRQRGIDRVLRDAAAADQFSVYNLDKKPEGSVLELHAPGIAVYQPWLSNMQEGWSRYVIEEYQFPYKNIHNEEIRAGDLIQRYDVIYLPDIRAEGIVEGREEGTTPPLFADGIGAEGVANLKKFVEAGGTLITIGESSELVIGGLGLPVRNVLKGLERKEFYCPGSILGVSYDPNNPVTYGMQPESMAFFSNSPAYKVVPNFKINANVAAKYPGKNILKSGYLLGENYVANQAAVVDVPLGSGRVVLIGFAAINRAQAHNTFKILFNSLLLSTARATAL